MDDAQRRNDVVGRTAEARRRDLVGAGDGASEGAVAPLLSFIDAINRRDVAAIVDLLADDHVLIDSGGGEVRGRDAVRRAWEAYFGMVPDYCITVERTLAAGGTVVVVGSAAGTYSPDGALLEANRWSTPAAWRAEVQDGRVAVWQVFAVNEPMRRLMRGRGAEEEAR